MIKQFVRDYLLEHKKNFIINYKASVKAQNVDTVHDMRVAVKRLNTVVKMLNFNEKANFRLKKALYQCALSTNSLEAYVTFRF
ncbi:MAG: hypothetical protein HC831_06775 [Chloroflexia bacterium]|nr:hypothetical protein [Chloroflexia bacterium]